MSKSKASPTDAAGALRLDRQLCFQLYLASKTLTQAYQQWLAPLDLTYPQYLALLVLWENDGILVRELSDRLELDSGTLSPLLKRLQAKGIVAKARDPEDERAVRVRLTAAGQALKAQARCVPASLLEASGLTMAQAEELFRELARLNGNLKG